MRHSRHSTSPRTTRRSPAWIWCTLPAAVVVGGLAFATTGGSTPHQADEAFLVGLDGTTSFDPYALQRVEDGSAGSGAGGGSVNVVNDAAAIGGGGGPAQPGGGVGPYVPPTSGQPLLPRSTSRPRFPSRGPFG